MMGSINPEDFEAAAATAFGSTASIVAVVGGSSLIEKVANADSTTIGQIILSFMGLTAHVGFGSHRETKLGVALLALQADNVAGKFLETALSELETLFQRYLPVE